MRSNRNKNGLFHWSQRPIQSKVSPVKNQFNQQDPLSTTDKSGEYFRKRKAANESEAKTFKGYLANQVWDDFDGQDPCEELEKEGVVSGHKEWGQKLRGNLNQI